MTELSREDTPRVEALIDKVMADNPRHTAYAQAKYYEEVHQHLAPLARDLERELRSERAVSDRLLEALKMVSLTRRIEGIEHAIKLIAEVEAMRKEQE